LTSPKKGDRNPYKPEGGAMNEDITKMIKDLYSNPFFKKGFLDFFEKMQLEGIEAARKFWKTYPEKDMFPNAPELFEKLIDLYLMMGVVPRKKYEDVVKEHEEMKKEVNKLVKGLNLDMMLDEGAKAQEMWKGAIDRQIDMNKEITKNFFDFLKKISSKK